MEGFVYANFYYSNTNLIYFILNLELYNYIPLNYGVDKRSTKAVLKAFYLTQSILSKPTFDSLDAVSETSTRLGAILDIDRSKTLHLKNTRPIRNPTHQLIAALSP